VAFTFNATVTRRLLTYSSLYCWIVGLLRRDSVILAMEKQINFTLNNVLILSYQTNSFVSWHFLSMLQSDTKILGMVHNSLTVKHLVLLNSCILMVQIFLWILVIQIIQFLLDTLIINFMCNKCIRPCKGGCKLQYDTTKASYLHTTMNQIWKRVGSKVQVWSKHMCCWLLLQGAYIFFNFSISKLMDIVGHPINNTCFYVNNDV